MKWGRKRILQATALLCAVLLPLSLSMSEALACGPDIDGCPLSACCAPCLTIDIAIPHTLEVLSYKPELIQVSPPLLVRFVYRPPWA